MHIIRLISRDSKKNMSISERSAIAPEPAATIAELRDQNMVLQEKVLHARGMASEALRERDRATERVAALEDENARLREQLHHLASGGRENWELS